MLVLDQKTIGKGFREIHFIDDPNHPDFKKVPFIRTLDQYYYEGKWKTGSMFTGDKFAYNGKTPYRRPVSILAHLKTIFPGWFIKVYRRINEKLGGYNLN